MQLLRDSFSLAAHSTMGKKQAKPAPSQLLFHEALGQALTQKFTEITQQTTRRSSVATFFATGISEQQSGDEKPSITVTEVVVPAEAQAPTCIEEGKLPCPIPVGQPFPETKNVLEEHRGYEIAVAGKSYSLGDLNAFQAIEQLVSRHGRMTHMGIRDHNYDLFLNRAKTGVISYRLIDGKVAVISGDPICPVREYKTLLDEFQAHCKEHHWQWAMQGGSGDMARIARENSWTTVHYGRERALNVQTNPVLLGSEGKRIRTQCKSLQKTTNVDVYCPAYVRDHQLEQKIVKMYDDWRGGRNTSRSVQAYITVFDLLAFHRLLIFVYTHDQGKLTGFATLRRLKEGYHIDPITVAPDAPRGLTDLLLISSMSLLKASKVTRLVLGVEPLEELGEIHGMSKPLERLTRKSHRLVSAEIHQGGKRGFNDRFRPHEAFEEQLYMVYPNSPGIKQSVAMAHFANIRLHEAIKQRVAKEREKRRRNSDPEVKHDGAAAVDGAKAVVDDIKPEVAAQDVHKQPGRPLPLPGDQCSRSPESTPGLLAIPTQRGRASSLSRLFRRFHSDQEILLSQESNPGKLEASPSVEVVTPPVEERASSRGLFFRRKSSDMDRGRQQTLATHE